MFIHEMALLSSVQMVGSNDPYHELTMAHLAWVSSILSSKALTCQFRYMAVSRMGLHFLRDLIVRAFYLGSILGRLFFGNTRIWLIEVDRHGDSDLAGGFWVARVGLGIAGY